MDDLQLNITATKSIKKKPPPKKSDSTSNEYKFVSKPFSGKTIARKRPHNHNSEIKTNTKPGTEEPQKKYTKVSEPNPSAIIDTNLRDLSENKGKYHGKNYQELSDDLQVKQKPRSGGWISSLFKNNPNVPKLGQRAVKPLVEKVFAGKTFADLDIHPHSVANLQQNLNLKELMTVQQKAIPVILQGRDLLIRSQTGSGKTLAYALPIIEGLQAIRPKINRHNDLKVVVVVPTRELAVQTYELFVKLVKPFTWIVPGLLSGGQKRKAEKARLRKGLSILVGTPGRINDHLRHTQSLNFAKTSCLVLDEADRLLDMGYEKDVAAIVKAIEDHKLAATYDPMAMVKQTVVRKTFEDEAEVEGEKEPDIEQKHNLTKVFTSKERQTILLSATLTKAVENLAGITMKDPVFVDTSEGRSVVADSLGSMLTPAQRSKEPVDTSAEDAIDKMDEESEDEPEIEKEVVKETPAESKKGLPEFKGSSHLDLFELGLQKGLDTKTKNSKTNEDSDSDSDYEYFKAQKELETKTSAIDEIDEEEVKTEKVESVFSEALKNAITEDELILPASVNQTFLIVPMKLRLVTLCSLIVEHCVINTRGGKMIVFVATLEMVDYLSDLIETVLVGKEDKVKKKQKANKKRQKESDVASSGSDSEFEIDYQAPAEGGLVPVELDMFKLHGSMPHEDRIQVFQTFRKAKRGVLICTDVAARGVDVPKVDLVLQFCAPASATDYVHRVGRTGRATQVGSAILCLLPSEAEFVRYLESKRIRLRQADESRVLEPLRHIAPGAGVTAHKAAASVQARLEATAHSSREWLARASRAYTSWVRFYSAYPREVREYLDGRNLHLGHAAKAFALRDTPAALAKRVKNDPNTQKQKPTNRLTVKEDEERRRPGFPRVKIGSLGGAKTSNKQSSMHTASEFDSGLEPLHKAHANKKKKNKNK